MKKLLLVCLTWFFISACSSTHISTYQQLGGQPKIEEVIDNFITEIEFDPVMYEFFKDSNINRFREKVSEHICMLTGGPCEYTGDNMKQVHAGMYISESEFNHAVDLFIIAMTKADLPHTIQNKILAVIVPTRDEMIYLY
ncbi:MAG: hemoglobin [Paraglaciecola sp.]|jgi:hemoglobin